MTTFPTFSRAAKLWLLGVGVVLLSVVLLVVFFPWDALRGPINRHVSERLGRKFEITRHLDVQLGRISTVRFDGIELANPPWASSPYLLKARAGEFDVRLWPLLTGKVELPRIVLTEPEIGLQIEPDGRRTWALSRDTADDSASPDIGTLQVDRGTVHYRASAQGADVKAQFDVAAQPDSAAGDAAPLPLSYQAAGTWKKEPFKASGRTGGVLHLGDDIQAPFPIELNASTGRTTLKANGTLTNFSRSATVDGSVDLQGPSLAALYPLTGVVLPTTAPYKLRGKLTREGSVWSVRGMQGVLGSSDLRGDMSFDTAAAVPLLTGKLQSKVLDFADLGPMIGVGSSPGARGRPGRVNQRPKVAGAPVPAVATGKVLPVAVLDFAKLRAMNADVTYSAADIRHVKALPLDKGSAHIKLKDGILELQPISLGVAGGTLAGSIRIDARALPASLATQLDARGLRFNQLFPTVQLTKNSLGKMSGKFDLRGRGNSAAQMLGTSTGNVALLMGQGEISNILLEYLGLDGGEIIKFFLRGDRNVELRCAAAAFDVKDGLMASRVIVLDTADTIINGQGSVNLASESLDILLNPQPKDASILSLRSPLRIGGTFASPTAGPDKAALGLRAGLALALGAINPLLALAATIETGPGVDSNCSQALTTAAKPSATTSKRSRPVPAPRPAGAQP